MFKLARLIPYLLKLLKFLEKKKGLIYPLILIKVVNYLISFIFKAEKIGLTSIIKIVYYFLSISNFLLALIVLGVFSYPNLLELVTPNFLTIFITWLWEGLHLMIPAIILNFLNDYFTHIVEFFRVACKRFIDWVLTDSNTNVPEISKDINKSNNNRKPVDVYDPFYAKRYVDSEDFYQSYNGIPEIDLEPHKIGWKDYVLFGVVAVAVTYYLYPDMYNNIYYALKGKIFPGGGKGSPDLGGNNTSNYNPQYKVYKGKNFSATSIPVTSEQILRSNMEEIAFSGLTSAEKNASLLHLYNDVLKSGDIATKSNQIVDIALELNNTITVNPTMNPFTMDLNRLRYVIEPTSNLIMPLDLTSPDSLRESLTPIATSHIPNSMLGDIPKPESTGSITPKGVTAPPVLEIDTNVGAHSGSINPTSLPQPSPTPLPVRSLGYTSSLDDLSWIARESKLRGYYSPSKPGTGVDVADLMDKLNNIK